LAANSATHENQTSYANDILSPKIASRQNQSNDRMPQRREEVLWKPRRAITTDKRQSSSVATFVAHSNRATRVAATTYELCRQNCVSRHNATKLAAVILSEAKNLADHQAPDSSLRSE
jgi:hypothetical protein